MYKPFPYIFIRYASLPCNTLQPLQLHGINRFLQFQHHVEHKLSAAREALCNELYKAIPLESNDHTRHTLIQLKRDVHNNKARAIVEIPASLEYELQEYNHWQNKLTQLNNTWEQYYNRQLLHHRQCLQHLATNELLQQGLLLSSQALYEQLPYFIQRDPATFRHKELKNENSLLRYLTRMTFKTSPFSTFTSTGIATLDEQIADIDIPVSLQTKSNTRCNNSLFGYIQSLLLHHPVLNDLLLIRLNGTVSIENDTIQFLVNYFNVESFQTIPASGIIQWLIDFFRKHEEVDLAALTSQVATYVVDADHIQVKNFLLKLINAGLLEAGTGTSGIHPDWIGQLCSFLETRLKDDPGVHSLYTTLQHLRMATFRYNAASAIERRQILQQAANLLNTTLEALQQEAGIEQYSEQMAREKQEAFKQQWKTGQFGRPPFIPRRFSSAHIFYEDSSVTDEVRVPRQMIDRFVSNMQTLCKLISLLDPLQRERAHMCDFFLKQYGQDSKISATDFYHAWYSKEKRQQVTVQRPNDTWELLLKRMDISISDAQQQINIRCTEDRQSDTQPHPASGAVFVQFFKADNTYKGVINHFLPGMGKVAGRFLDLFEQPVTEQFNAWNMAQHPASVLMELSDGSGFNANIHPPLLPYELSMPGGHNNYPANRQVNVKDLFIQYHAGDHSLYLWHAAWQKKVFAFDLSLEAFTRRSNFYQLLAHFNTEYRMLSRQFNLLIDAWALNKAPLPVGDVVHKARIVFERDIILRRAGWVVPTHMIPVQENSETEAAWFGRLNAWRQQHHIPEHVFVFLKSPYMPVGEKKSTALSDDHKPQYIHFGSPLLAGVFKKMINRSTQVYIEEMLPDISYLEGATWQRATEYLVHWYTIK
jgi:hypothetical protein